MTYRLLNLSSDGGFTNGSERFLVAHSIFKLRWATDVPGIEPERPAAPLAPLPPAPRRIEEEPQPPPPKPRVKKISPPQEPPPAAVPQTIPVELRTAREYEPPVEPQAPPSDRLRVNIDEILRLGAIMERRHMSSTKK
ncbi:hypothetical protein TELCIR_10841, partial [Teladorsagia circumcincta]